MKVKKLQTRIRDSSKYGTGFSDELQPLEALDLSKVKNFDELARGMSKTAFRFRADGRVLGPNRPS